MSIAVISEVMAKSYAFVELKSYGDLVITAASIRLLKPSDVGRCCLVMGSHLNDLAESLALPCATELVQLADKNVPALFDIKKRGAISATRSALALRTALSKAAPGHTLVLPRSSFRERFIAGQRTWEHLPAAENVYLAAEKFLKVPFSYARLSAFKPTARPSRIAICPFSRVEAKNLPDSLIIDIAAVCISAGFEPELLLLEGERLEAQSNDLPVRSLPRRFDALSDALAEYAGVVSADSLPAHLAEYRNTPAFIATPVPNTYWLPFRAFEKKHWGLFYQVQELMVRLKHFLDFEN